MIDVSVRAELWDVDAEAPPSIFCGSAPAAPQSPSLARLPRVFSGRAAPRRSLGGRKQVVAPLELKTGKAFHGHRAQARKTLLVDL